MCGPPETLMRCEVSRGTRPCSPIGITKVGAESDGFSEPYLDSNSRRHGELALSDAAVAGIRAA